MVETNKIKIDYSKIYSTKCESTLRDMSIDKINEISEDTYDILDVGSLKGYIAKKIKFKTLTLVNLKFLEKEEIDSVKYIEMDIYDFAKTNKKKYDLIILMHIIEHIHSPYKLLYILHKSLKSDGIIYICYPNARSLNRILGVELGMLKSAYELSEGDKRIGHVSMYDITFVENLEWHTQGKFKLIDYGGFMFKPLSNAQMDWYFRESLELFKFLGTRFKPKILAEIWCIIKKNNKKGKK